MPHVYLTTTKRLYSNV